MLENEVFLLPHNPKWVREAKEEIKHLLTLFKPLRIDLYHIGSTALSECKAKPILDILGIVSDILEIDEFNHQLEKLGYEAKGEFGMKRRRFFIRFEKQAVNLHIFEDTDPEVERHLRFGDYLRAHPEAMKRYSNLKEALACQYSKDRNQYCLGKTSFIKEIDRLAALEGKPSNRQWGAKRKSWTKEQIRESMEANMQLVMTYYAKYIPSQEIVFEKDVTVVRADMPDDTFNYIVSAKFEEKCAKERIQAVLDHYRKKGLPFSWWVGEGDTPYNLTDYLQDAGLEKKEENFGMYKELVKMPRKKTPLRIKRVEEQTRLSDFASIFVNLGRYAKIDAEYYQLIPPILYQEKSPLQMYVGYEGNQAVTTGVVVMHANVAGIYYVMTLPSHRKRGYATAMMEHVLECAQNKGFYLATLQASEKGKNLYESMGFQKSSLFVEYSTNL